MVWFILTCMVWFILTCMVWFNLTCMVWFIHQNVLLIISTWQWANCSIFVIVICPLLPHSSAQAEGEDDGEELGGGYDHQRTYHQVQVAPHQVGELGAAPSGEVGVGLVGPGCTGGVRGAQQEGVVWQNTAGLRNLAQSISIKNNWMKTLFSTCLPRPSGVFGVTLLGLILYWQYKMKVWVR